MLGNDDLAPSPGDLRLTHGTPVKLPSFVSNHPGESRYLNLPPLSISTLIKKMLRMCICKGANDSKLFDPEDE